MTNTKPEKLWKFSDPQIGIIEVLSDGVTWSDGIQDDSVTGDSDLAFVIGFRVLHEGCEEECSFGYCHSSDVEPYGTYLCGRKCLGVVMLDDEGREFEDAVHRIVACGASETKLNDLLTLRKDPE